MVVEADESDGTFLKLPADIADQYQYRSRHLDHFETFEAIKDAFRAFIENIPFYGFAVMCLDHPTVQELVGRIEDRRIITYGENPQADARLVDVDLADGKSCFGVVYARPQECRGDPRRDMGLPMPGHHNALNATAAIAVAHELGIEPRGCVARLRISAVSSAVSRRPASGMACVSSTIMAIIRSRSPPSCAPRVPRPRAR